MGTTINAFTATAAGSAVGIATRKLARRTQYRRRRDQYGSQASTECGRKGLHQIAQLIGRQVLDGADDGRSAGGCHNCQKKERTSGRSLRNGCGHASMASATCTARQAVSRQSQQSYFFPGNVVLTEPSPQRRPVERHCNKPGGGKCEHPQGTC